MRKRNELKTWEKQLLRKRLLIMAGVTIFLFLAAGVVLFALFTDHHNPPKEHVGTETTNTFWDEVTGQYYEVVSVESNRKAISEHVSLGKASILLENGAREKRDILVSNMESGDYMIDISSLDYYKGSMVITHKNYQSEIPLEEYVALDYVYVYRYSDDEIVICIVSLSHDVADSRGTPVVQTTSEGICYSYICLNRAAIHSDTYGLFVGDEDVTDIVQVPFMEQDFSTYEEDTEPLRAFIRSAKT